MIQQKSKIQKGFTLIELMVVISIIAMLSSIILASLNTARDKAHLTAQEEFEANVLHSIGDQLVGRWDFDETSGTITTDTSGFGNNGTISGTFSRVSGVVPGTALSFNYSGSVSIPDSQSIDIPENSFTLSVWTETNMSGDGWIFNHGSFGLGDYHGLLRLCTNPLVGCVPQTGDMTLSDGKWHNLVVVGDTKSIRVYFDGTVITKSDQISAPYSGIMSGGLTLCSGYSGLIDNVRLYATPYTTAQVEQLYAEGLKSHNVFALR